MKTSIIIPAYNEEKTIAEILDRTLFLPIEKEVIVVDDGSTDDTYFIAKQFNIRVIRHGYNKGKGRAIRTGLENASGAIIAIQDADLEYPPEQIPASVKLIDDGKADVVFGSRFIGEVSGMSLTHQIGNRLITVATNILYGSAITDMETGHKVFRRDVLDGVTLTENRFEIEPELTAKILKQGYKITEVPIDYSARKEGSKIGVFDGIMAFIWLLRFKVKP